MSNPELIVYCTPLIAGERGYLRSYDPEAHNGRGHVELTKDKDRAAVLTFAALMRLRNAVPKCHPLRPDGKPNRPLSAFTLETIPRGGDGSFGDPMLL